MKMPQGEVGILNVGAGDTKLVFDPENPAETIRAGRIVKDMLRRGYALLVATGESDAQGRPKMARAYDFDEKTAEYIIADLDPVTAAAVDSSDAETEDKQGKEYEPSATPGGDAPPPEARQSRKRGRPPLRVHASTTSAVAVARTAGG